MTIINWIMLMVLAVAVVVAVYSLRDAFFGDNSNEDYDAD